jgi:hypothetical protein
MGKPKPPPLTFGVEIETVGTTPSGATALLQRAGLPAVTESYGSSNNYAQWECKADSSIDGEGGGAEVVSPVLKWGTPDHYSAIAKVTGTLADNGVGVNDSCGLHVHVGIRHLDPLGVASIARLYGALQDSIERHIAPCRNESSYGERLPSFEARGWRSLERYIDDGELNYAPLGRGAVNLDIDRHGTVEFRRHHATMSARTILSWAGLMVGIVTAAATVTRNEYRELPDGTLAGDSASGVWEWLESRNALSADAHIFHTVGA